MIRTFIVFHWELRRLTRSLVALGLILAIPIALSAVAFRGNFGGELLVASVISGWAILGLRSLADKVTGFTEGLESTPAGGTSIFASKLLVGLIVTAVQIGLFAGIARLLA